MHHSAAQCSTVQPDTVQFITVQYSAAQSSTVKHSAKEQKHESERGGIARSLQPVRLLLANWLGCSLVLLAGLQSSVQSRTVGYCTGVLYCNVVYSAVLLVIVL